ncbi:ATPase component of ABC transporter [Burkholderia dolosa AU0158]|nr:ATPase component of ABC transporter [Burkholderia dolosa AU0158]
MNRVGKIVPPKRQILKDISLSFFPGAKIGVLGLNGSGKSTMIRIMAGVDKDIEGEANADAEPEHRLSAAGTAARPEQDGARGGRGRPRRAIPGEQEARGNLRGVRGAGRRLRRARGRAGEIRGDPRVERRRQPRAAARSGRRCAAPAAVGREDRASVRRRKAPRRAVQAAAREARHAAARRTRPTTSMPESVDWLEQFLVRFPGTVVAVTHDRYFLDNAAEWILELDRGHGIPWKGNYSSWLDQKEERLKQEEAAESARQKAIKKELEWVRQNPKGRQAKSKARIARFEELNSQEYQKRNETQEIFIPVGDRLGNEVIEFKNVSKSYGDRLLIDNLSFKIPPGAIVGIIGPNGAGKSTLFRMITGKEQPDSGEIVTGPTVKLAYVDQSRDALDGSKTVFEEISGGADVLTVGKYETPSRAYIGRFNFKGGDQQKIVGNLSGGERGRLHLAKTLISGGNVLLLDEPSNDLDVETLRALEDALLEFAGSVMVISHDRWFLDRIATHILAFEGDSQVTFFDGNYQEYEADKRARLGEEAAKPKRIRYKPISR